MFLSFSQIDISRNIKIEWKEADAELFVILTTIG